MLETIFGIIGIIVAISLYYAGVHQGRRLEKERQKHEISLEQDRRIFELSEKLTDEYVKMTRSSYDSGIHALGRLGLDQLKTSSAIRDAIDKMTARTGKDPLGRDRVQVEGINLFHFFKFIRDNQVDFFRTSLADAVRLFKEKELRKQ